MPREHPSALPESIFCGAHAPSSQASLIAPSRLYSSWGPAESSTSQKVRGGIYGNSKRKDIGLWSNGQDQALEVRMSLVCGKREGEKGGANVRFVGSLFSMHGLNRFSHPSPILFGFLCHYAFHWGSVKRESKLPNLLSAAL